MKSLGSLRMGLISATLTVAAGALVLPAGYGNVPNQILLCTIRGRATIIICKTVVTGYMFKNYGDSLKDTY